ncbi:MAG: hypothetical protein SPF89_12670 [Sphaerochaetaceae bacterium]|nr:hypothetical protein [Spirochaetales bacterium]MDY5500946.1 hypothetical protein [Sphaerochaetaceae bacterium]
MKKSLMQAWTQSETPLEQTTELPAETPGRRGRASTIQADPEQVRTTTIRLSEENIIYCNLMSKQSKGSSMSGYINALIEKDRASHPKESQKAKKIYQIQLQ